MLRIERLGRVPLAILPTDIDVANVPAVEAHLRSAVSSDAPGIVVDLADTRYLDSAALSMLFAFNQRLRQRRQTLLLVVPADAMVRQVITIAGLDSAVDVYPTRAAAIDAVERIPAQTIEDRRPLT